MIVMLTQCFPSQVGGIESLMSNLALGLSKKNQVIVLADSYNSIQDDGSLHFVCWTNVLENEFFTAAANVIIEHLGKEFPKVTRSPGPFAFSEEKYVKQILNASDNPNMPENRLVTREELQLIIDKNKARLEKASEGKVKSILKMSESCLVKNLGHASFNECVSEAISKPKHLFELYQRYGNEFEGRSALVCACERGRMNDVLLFVNLHRFHKYIEMNGVKEGNMTVKEMVNQVGRNSRGRERTPLMIAAENEHFQIVKYLIEQGEADPNIANRYGQNALHYAAPVSYTHLTLPTKRIV